MQGLNTIQQISVLVLPVLFAITVHEAAHGWMAKKLGDHTAEMLGRVTLNPLRHIDVVGTVIVPLLTLVFGGILFGWAKPVPINGRNLRHPQRDLALVALAGPAANLLMALGWAATLKVGVELADTSHWVALPLVLMGQYGIVINAVLLALNLLPVLPLDGGRILAAALPPRAAQGYSRLEPYGLFIVLGLLATGFLGTILEPAVAGVQALAQALVGL
jgi:Zn-dependent protease